MSVHIQIIAVAILCALLMFDGVLSSSEDDGQLFVELQTGHLTIPVPYRPQEDYTHGGSPPEIIPIPEPEIEINITTKWVELVRLSNITTKSSIDSTATTTTVDRDSSPHHSSEKTGTTETLDGRSSDKTTKSTPVQQGRGLSGTIKKKQSRSGLNDQQGVHSIDTESSASNISKDVDAEVATNEVGDEDDDYDSLQFDSGQKLRMLAQMNVGGKYIPEPHDTDAQWGDHCNPTGALEWDYCEKAKYPNKGRMVCATLDVNTGLTEGTCVCKFAKHNATSWRQLQYHKVTNVCRSPEGGVCDVKFRTERTTSSGDPVYFKSLSKAHEQCEDDEKIGTKKRRLMCSKPHPRRFPSYNAYHYYCLKKEDRLPSWTGRLEVQLSLTITMFWISYFHPFYFQ